ncbi:alpha/beta hydrolase [Austwickia chelonae]|uniref:alpha/beta hydrolase n=1 Tax=Austwickia chelonae TaxID=100225 RepID=UPI000E2609C6|nr:alpha/beta hydrolase [Austwickia chelonae]
MTRKRIRAIAWLRASSATAALIVGASSVCATPVAASAAPVVPVSGIGQTVPPAPVAAEPRHMPRVPQGWVEEEIAFPSASGTVYGTWFHPIDTGEARPAALLIAGSGPTDRNGNSAVPGFRTLGSLQAVARIYAAQGVPSLRYDKLGSGKTGMGTVGQRPPTLEMFRDQSERAFVELSRRPGVDQGRLIAVGHSEGGLFAQLLTLGERPGVPVPRGINLLAPLPERYLDVIAEQLVRQVDSALAAGQLSPEEAGDIKRELAAAVAAIRAGKPLPELKGLLAQIFNPGVALYLQQIDRHDPAVLAGRARAGTEVLVTCSEADIQVGCPEVHRLADGFTGLYLGPRFVALKGVNHVLKEDASRDPRLYSADVPYSTQLKTEITRFAARLTHQR